MVTLTELMKNCDAAESWSWDPAWDLHHSIRFIRLNSTHISYNSHVAQTGFIHVSMVTASGWMLSRSSGLRSGATSKPVCLLLPVMAADRWTTCVFSSSVWCQCRKTSSQFSVFTTTRWNLGQELQIQDVSRETELGGLRTPWFLCSLSLSAVSLNITNICGFFRNTFNNLTLHWALKELLLSSFSSSSCRQHGRHF